MSAANVWVVLATLNKEGNKLSVGFFDYVDAMKNSYFSPYEDIDATVNEDKPENGQWRFLSPDGDWKPLGYFISLDDTHALSVVSKLNKKAYLQGREGADLWSRRGEKNLPSPEINMASHL